MFRLIKLAMVIIPIIRQLMKLRRQFKSGSNSGARY